MSSKLTTLEDFLSKYLKNQKSKNGADTYEEYKNKIGANYNTVYGRGMQSLYVDALKSSPSYKQNYANLENKGLQNSGYKEYLADKNANLYEAKAYSLAAARNNSASKTARGYLEYLEKYENEQTRKTKSVMTHLIENSVVDPEIALSYAIGQGLSEEDATAVVKSAYSINRQKVLNSILEQTVSLGLDRDGAVLLAKKMGITDSDAEKIGYEVEELLKYYGNVSDSYLQYLEQKSNKTTNTFD